MSEFTAEAHLIIDEIEGTDAAFSEPVSVPMETTPLSRRSPSDPMGGMAGMDAGGGPSLTSLAEDRNETLEEILDEIEAADSALGGGGGGAGAGDIAGGLGLAQIAAAGSAAFGLDQLTQQGTTGEDQPLGPIADLLMDANTEEEATENTRKRLFGQEEPPIDAGALGQDAAAAFNETVGYPELPDLSSAAEWPDLPDLSTAAEWPDIPQPDGANYWPDIPEPSNIGIDVPAELQGLVDVLTGGGSGTGGSSDVPVGNTPSSGNLPSQTGGGGPLDVNISDFRIDGPSDRELESAVERYVKDFLEKEGLRRGP